MPVFGPSDPRDAVGLAVDAAMDPFTWVGQGTAVVALDWSRRGVSAVDARERHLDDIESTKRTALDPYATFRSLYRQHREYNSILGVCAVYAVLLATLWLRH